MKVDLEATRALLAETGRWVDLWKVYERALAEDGSEADPAMRARHKQSQALSETLTPMVKYCATEMGNRVCYQAMQVHGGVGYMHEFTSSASSGTSASPTSTRARASSRWSRPSASCSTGRSIRCSLNGRPPSTRSTWPRRRRS